MALLQEINLDITNSKVQALLRLQVLLLDEVSMIDTDCGNGVMDTLSVIDHTRRPNAYSSDPFGSVHVILFGLQEHT